MGKKSVLEEIIEDYAPLSKTLRRVGLVGSYARGDFTEESDIDLVFDIITDNLDDDTFNVAMMVKNILLNQFRKNVDIIIYNVIVTRMDIVSDFYFKEGHQKMYEDLVWFWESDRSELYK